MGKKRIIQQQGDESALQSKKESSSVMANLQKGIKAGRIYVQATYNNTLISLTDVFGNALAQASAGSSGFKGTKKSTPFAASKVAGIIGDKVLKLGIEDVSVFIKGIGSGRDSTLRTLAGKGLNIVQIKDITPFAHGGCRPPKVRRV